MKDEDRTEILYFSFLERDLLTLRQNYDTSSGHEQSSCEVGTSNVFP